MRFSSNQRQKTFTITATADDTAEDGEHVVISLGRLPSKVTAGTPATAQVAIRDDDRSDVTVSFGAAQYEVVEGASIAVTVMLDEAPQRLVDVPLTLTYKGGASAADYAGVPSRVRFSSNEKQKTFTLIATEDDTVEDGETVVIGLGKLPGKVAAGTPAATSVMIHDKPDVTVSVSPASYRTSENNAAVLIRVRLSAETSREVTVKYATSSRTARAGKDYKTNTGTLTFPAGDDGAGDTRVDH